MTRNGPVKELPHDLLSEKSLLGCLIADSSAFEEIISLKLTAEDFYHPIYGIIFNSIKELYQALKPIDYVTISSHLSDLGKIEEVGGQAFILELVEDYATSTNVIHYAKTVKEKSLVRNVVRTAMSVAETGVSYAGDVEDFISEVESKFFKLTLESKTGGLLKLNHCLKQNLKELEDDSRTEGEIAGLSTGFDDLDKKLLGLQAGQLIVLAARPAMGKTSFALNVATNSCKRSGLPVVIFSLEMLAAELSMKILSSEAHIDSRKLKTKNFHDSDLRSIGKAVQSLSQMPIFINDSGDTTLADIQGHCRKVKIEHGLGLVIVDYLQLMRSSGSQFSTNREQQISEISRGLKSLAKELECPIISLSQLNRGVESRTDKRPILSDLRESGSIEQDADIVLMIYRDEVYNQDTKEKGIAEIIIGKNRSGETGTTKLSWIGPTTSFHSLAKNYQDAPQNH